MTEVEGARNFMGTGDAYDRFMGRYSQLLAPIFADFCGSEYGDRLLDVGCGPGAFTAVAADRLGPGCVVGVDPSPSFAAACRERHPGVDVRVGAAEELPADDDAFDIAVAQLVMHFASDAPRAAREMRRVVRPGGVVAVSVWDSGDGMGLLRVLRDARRALEGPDDDQELHGYGSEGQLAALLDGAGLVEVKETTLTMTARYAGFDDLWNGLLSGIGPAGAYVATLSDAERAHYREALHAQVGSPAGDFVLTAAARTARGVVPG